MDDQITISALEYHRLPRPGKISILPTKPLTNQRDLALAYSPGAAAACKDPDPDAGQVAEIALLAAEEMRRFGIQPRVALLSASNFGSVELATARKMREALRIITERAPGLEAEGEMHGDAALSEEIRMRVFPNSRLRGEANLLMMPTLDAANIAFNLLKTAAGDGVTIGPILLGAARAVHILTASATVRRIVNMAALAVAGAAGERARPSSLA